MSAASSPTYSLKLAGRSDVAERTIEFRFLRPAEFRFKAGQSMDLTLIDPPQTDAEGNTRAFSINSAPDEPELIFTTRLRDTAFKRVLSSLPAGTAISAQGPFGSFTLHNNASRPAILLAGGIGVTPFRSIVRTAERQKLPHRIILFYSNRQPQGAPFLDELRSLEQRNPNFTFVPVMTQASPSQWNGERGHIDGELLGRHLDGVLPVGNTATAPIFYIAGPPNMVAGLRTVLNGVGIDDDDIRTEEFAGY
jgi:ferredoxin-NADP reductase